MADKSGDERPRGDAGLWAEPPRPSRRGLALLLVTAGILALAVSGGCTIYATLGTFGVAAMYSDWMILAALPLVLIPGGAAILVSVWMSRIGLRLWRGKNECW